MRIATQFIGLILASALAYAAEPPPDLVRQVAKAATAAASARDNYTYRQTLTLEEVDHRDMVVGEYKEVRDVTFSPSGSRYEQPVGAATNTLTRIKLTPEDFSDIRNVQPFMLTMDNYWLYKGDYKGEEQMDGQQCFVLHLAPKQILSGQRFFEGLIWVRESDYSLVRSEGQAVPQMETTQKQNLFPHFTTVMKPVDGKWWFPAQTYADDTLFFKDWPQRIRIVIAYSRYEKFGVDTKLSFDTDAPAQTQPPPPKP